MAASRGQSSITSWLTKPTPTSQSTAPVSTQEREQGLTPHLVPPRIGTDTSDLLISRQQFSSQPTTIDEHNCSANGTIEPIAGNHLPPAVHFRRPEKVDLAALRRLHQLLLPIPYPEAFYKETFQDKCTNDVSLLAMWRDESASADEKIVTRGDRHGLEAKLVGAIRCKVLLPAPTASMASPMLTFNRARANLTGEPLLYISTLLLTSPNRSLGIASAMLSVVERVAIEKYGCTSVGAHVWEANTEALQWYRKRGFVERGKEEGYYRRLKPEGAVVVLKSLQS